MRWFDKARKAMATLFRREQETARLDEEMRFHVEQQTAENVARGMSAEEARRKALKEFGNPALLRDEARDGWLGRWMETTWRDLRFGARALRRSSGFSLTAIGVMALCIGATTCLFTVVRSVLLSPLPFREPDNLVMVYEHFRANVSQNPYNPLALYDFYQWRSQTHGFEDMAVHYEANYNVTGDHGELPEVVEAQQGSWNLFPLLGVQPALGRSFTESEDKQGRGGVVMLTWPFFERRFGGDPSIMGKQIHLDGRSLTVIGVLPKSFAYPDAKTQLWVTATEGRTAEALEQPDNHYASAVARLRPGVSREKATEEVSALQYRIHNNYAGRPVAEDAMSRPMLDDVVEDVKTPLLIMMAAVLCVLLIGCLNVSNLLVARGAARQKEMAIRGALGAGRVALLREQMTETVILCALGGTVGMVLAWGGIEWLKLHWERLPRATSIHIDRTVVLFTVGVVFVTAVFAGLLPALSATQRGILTALKDGLRAGVSHARMRKLLLTGEIALTVVLLVSAGLLLKSFVRLKTADLGCVTDHVITMRYGLPKGQYDTLEKRVTFNESLLERVRQLPGVQAAGLSSTIPGAGWGGDQVFLVPERPTYEPGKQPDAATRIVHPGYFDALRIPLVSGRSFDNRDVMQPKTILINKELAKRYFPGENPLGRQIVMGVTPASPDRTFTIVGVVGDTLWRVGKPVKATMYFPPQMKEGNGGMMTLVVRTSGDPAQLALPAQKQIAALDPQLPVVDVLTIPEIVGESTVNQQFTASLVLAFAVISLVLAGVGLYGVLSYLVTQRVTEIGIRIALGAQRSQVLALILRDGMRPVAVGLAIGVLGGAGAGMLLRSLLYGTKAMDPMVFGGMVLTLLGVAALACAAPAWRASSVDPMQALRTE